MLSKIDTTSLPGGATTMQLFGEAVRTRYVLEALAIVVATALWFLLFTAFRVWTRPADVRPRQASADFPGDEPPAVVSLLAGG